MENKNILLVIISVFLFFIIIVGTGLLLFWPVPQTSGTADKAIIRMDRTLSQSDFDPHEFYKNDEQVPGFTSKEDEKEKNEGLLALEEKLKEEKQGKYTRDSQLAIGEVEEKSDVTIQKKREDAITKSTGTKSPIKEKLYTKPVTVDLKPKAKTQKIVKRSVHTRPKRAPQKTYVKEYWIQAASYKNRSKAEILNDKLKEVGLAGTIKTRDIMNDTYFRVRIGPYPNYNEAEKFLIWVKSIEGLEQSYISRVSRQS